MMPSDRCRGGRPRASASAAGVVDAPHGERAWLCDRGQLHRLTPDFLSRQHALEGGGQSRAASAGGRPRD